jgi:DNA-binding Lrp family transcriptional regulator
MLRRLFIRRITVFPEVVEFYTIGGEHDFMIKVRVPDIAVSRCRGVKMMTKS